ncbi:MAG: hypothetical protein P8170_25155 [Gemmatimonadota bacterium]
MEAHEALATGEGERGEEHPVEHAEHRGGGADAQAQGQDRRQGEDRITAEGALRKAELPDESLHGGRVRG